MNYKKTDEEIIKKKIFEKDEAKKKYEQKIGDIKFRRGINFSIEYLKSDNIDLIKFENMEYKPHAKNISLYYSEEYNNFNSIIFEVDDDLKFNTTNLTKELEKKYKLNLVVDEIEKAYNEYKEEIISIDKKYEDINYQSIMGNPELELKKGNS